MVYTLKGKQRMERLLEAFRNYLRANHSIDIVYSEKIGFFRIGTVDGLEAEYFERIESYDKMLGVLFSEFCSDVWVEKMRSGDKDDRMSLSDILRVRAIAEPVLQNLPEEDRQYAMDYLNSYLRREFHIRRWK